MKRERKPKRRFVTPEEIAAVNQIDVAARLRERGLQEQKDTDDNDDT